MFARCIRQTSRQAGRANDSYFGSNIGNIRHNSSSSSSPESTRNFSRPHEQIGSKPWMRHFAIGAGLGLVITQGYIYYDSKTKRDSFVTYSLVRKEPVSSTASIFYIEPKEKSEKFQTYKDAWRKGIWNVQFKQPQIQIVRAYTPLPPLETDNEAQQLRFLIRHDPHGEVSSYIHRLPIGSTIDLRGPNMEYYLSPSAKQVVFLAGGTGIAPALQIAHAMFDTPQNKATDTDGSRSGRKLHILWASRHREDCEGGVNDPPPSEIVPPKPTWSGLFSATPKPTKPAAPISDKQGPIVQELESLKAKYPGQITVEYFVNAEDTWIDEDAVHRALSRIDSDKDQGNVGGESRQILISGPPGFISYLAGPKEWKNGREEQGNVSKIVAHAISKRPWSVKVWKI